MNKIKTHLLIAYVLFSAIQCAGMEEKQKTNLEKFVLSLNNLPDELKALPEHTQHCCVANRVMNNKQLWYIAEAIDSTEYIKSAHFGHDPSQILYQKGNGAIEILDLNSKHTSAIPTPINIEHFHSAIWGNGNTKVAIFRKSKLDWKVNPIYIIHTQTGSLLNTLVGNKNITSLQWNNDDTHLMDSNSNIWDIDANEKITILPEDYEFDIVQWNDDGTRIAAICKQNNTLDIWDTKTKNVLITISVPYYYGVKKMHWNKNDTKIAMTSPWGVRIFDIEAKKLIVERPLKNARCRWKNSTEIFIYSPYKVGSLNRHKIMILDTSSGNLLSAIYKVDELRTFCCNNNEKLFLTAGFGIFNVWQRYTDYTEQQANLSWLIHKWILIKKINASIDSIEAFLDDIVSYWPLDKIALLNIWNTFPENVRKFFWEHKIKYFIKKRYHKPTTYQLMGQMTEHDDDMFRVWQYRNSATNNVLK